jgi:hypothetical protein
MLLFAFLITYKDGVDGLYEIGQYTTRIGLKGQFLQYYVLVGRHACKTGLKEQFHKIFEQLT